MKDLFHHRDTEGRIKRVSYKVITLSQPGLDAARQRAKVRDTLQFVIRQLDVEMVFQLGQEIERLQAVDVQRFEKIIVGRELLARHFEVRGGEREYLVERLVRRCHVHCVASET